MSRKMIIIICAAALILFLAALWLNRPADMTYDLTLRNAGGETVSLRLEVTLNKHWFRQTEITGTAYINGGEYRLYPVDVSSAGAFKQFRRKLRGVAAPSVGRLKGAEGAEDMLYISNVVLTAGNELRQLTASGFGQNDIYCIDISAIIAY